jgi:hypothetical protein
MRRPRRRSSVGVAGKCCSRRGIHAADYVVEPFTSVLASFSWFKKLQEDRRRGGREILPPVCHLHRVF